MLGWTHANIVLLFNCVSILIICMRRNCRLRDDLRQPSIEMGPVVQRTGTFRSQRFGAVRQQRRQSPMRQMQASRHGMQLLAPTDRPSGFADEAVQAQLWIYRPPSTLNSIRSSILDDLSQDMEDLNIDDEEFEIEQRTVDPRRMNQIRAQLVNETVRNEIVRDTPDSRSVSDAVAL